MYENFIRKSRLIKVRHARILTAALLLLSLTVGSSLAFTTDTVRGRITDENGEGIPGATILVKGTSEGTSSSSDGTFTLDRVDEKSTIVVSSVGYVTQEILLGNRKVLEVKLVSDQRLLQEHVVVGYGEQKKVNVIGSVSQIDSQVLENRSVTQVGQALTGQMPGVTVSVGSGRPGANEGTIRVRGVGSFGATPNALILVDGIPGTLNDISPDDIQSISVLKDASSAAIYGARSANGVILVTTKNGGSGKATITYNGYVGFNKATKLPDFVNSWEYAEMFNLASGSSAYSADDIAKYRNQSDPDNFPNTRFLDMLFSEKGIQTGHTININGGTERAKYFLSGGYLNQDGIIPKNNFRRYNVRLNLENQLAKNLKLTTRIGASSQLRNEPQATGNKGGELTDQLIQNAVRYPAVYLGQASNGDFGVGPESGGTPVAWIASSSYFKNPQNRLNTNVKLNWQPIAGLNVSAIGGYNFGLLERSSFNASQRLNANLNLAQSVLNQDRNKEIYKTLQFIGEYSKSFQQNNLDFLLGYSFENELSDYMSGYRQDFPSNDYTTIDMGGADNQQVNGYAEQWAIQSYFGRIRFNRSDKYLLEATLRYDGSSRFPDNNKFAVFPSAAAGWRISEEDFLKDVSWLSNLKLKASWGVLGNQNIGNYPYQTVLNSGRNYPFGNSIRTGAAYATYKDANIKWESTETTDIGIETEFFNRKLGFNATYYQRNTKDILFQPSASVSTVLGLTVSETNTGKAQNRGWEFDGFYRDKVGKLNYSVSGNFSIVQNKVVSLGLGNVVQPNGMVGNGSTLFNGYPMEMYYGYLSDGVFLDQQDIDAWPNQSSLTPNARPGDLRYRDISGPNGVPDGKVDATYDRTYLGSRIPKYTYSFTTDLRYKAFDFSLFFQGTAGVQGQLNNYAGVAFFNQGNIQRWQMEGRFDPANPQRYPDYPRLEVVTNSGTPNTLQSDFWVLNAAYLRVKNIQLGYSMPASILDRVKINRLRWYVSVENPFTLSKYRQGWDPEVNTSGAYYPILSTYTFGVNIKF